MKLRRQDYSREKRPNAVDIFGLNPSTFQAQCQASVWPPQGILRCSGKE